MSRFLKIMPKSIMNNNYKSAVIRERINLQDIKHMITSHSDKTVYLANVSKDGSTVHLALAQLDEELINKLLDEYSVSTF